MKQIKVFPKENQGIAAQGRNESSNSSFRLKKNIFIPLLIAAMTVTMNLQAQVRIGEDKAPEKGAILDLNSATKGGLLLPNVNIAELDEIPGTFTDAGSITASQLTGLVVYSLTPCPGVYVWDGGKWEKTGEPCPCPELHEEYPLCNDANTIADLNKKAGSGITWYDVSSGGTPRTNPLPINATTTLYAELSGNCAGAERIRVEVRVGDCSSKPTAGLITTFVKVMYDFQHQKLEAYKTSGGDATGFKWQVSTSSTFVDIPGAPNSKYYTVPANFYADAVAGILSAQTETTNKSLNFRCELSNPQGEVNTSNFNIIFINTSNYEKDAQGRKYVTLGKGSGGLTIADGSTATMKMLLLSLGQSGTGSKANGFNEGADGYDASDIGDFYQWGRVADGHEHTVWSKNVSTHINIIDNPAFGEPNATSDVISRGTPAYDVSNQQVQNGDPRYGKFIKGEIDWNTSLSNTRWGDGSANDTRASDISLSAWSYLSNNPCPGGDLNWRVPSRWNFWDLYKGTGNDTEPVLNSSPYSDVDNTWQFISATNNAIGGIIITSKASGGHTGEKVFLPIAGVRTNSYGTLLNMSSSTCYWSSTHYDVSTNAYSLYFNNWGEIENGSMNNPKASGQFVRCVAE
jgi:hypothetical protein